MAFWYILILETRISKHFVAAKMLVLCYSDEEERVLGDWVLGYGETTYCLLYLATGRNGSFLSILNNSWVETWVQPPHSFDAKAKAVDKNCVLPASRGHCSPFPLEGSWQVWCWCGGPVASPPLCVDQDTCRLPLPSWPQGKGTLRHPFYKAGEDVFGEVFLP